MFPFLMPLINENAFSSRIMSNSKTFYPELPARIIFRYLYVRGVQLDILELQTNNMDVKGNQ